MKIARKNTSIRCVNIMVSIFTCSVILLERIYLLARITPLTIGITRFLVCPAEGTRECAFPQNRERLQGVSKNIKRTRNPFVQMAQLASQENTQPDQGGQGLGSGVEQNFQNSGLGQSPVLPQTTVAPVPIAPPKKCFAGSRFQITINNDPTTIFPEIRDYLEKFGSFQYIIACMCS